MSFKSLRDADKIQGNRENKRHIGQISLFVHLHEKYIDGKLGNLKRDALNFYRGSSMFLETLTASHPESLFSARGAARAKTKK